MPRNVRVHRCPSGSIFDTTDQKLEEAEWLLNFARNANKPTPVVSAITTTKVNVPRRLPSMMQLYLLMHHQKARSSQLPTHDPLSRAQSEPATIAKFESVSAGMSVL